MTPPISLTTTMIFVLVSFVLVGLNAFFVASEFAIVKVRRTRLEELAGEGIASARVSLRMVDEMDESLSATQLGITLVSLGLGWIGEESFYNLFLYFFEGKFGHELLHACAAIVSFSIVTLLHVVLGELVPKSLAIQRAEKVVLLISPPLRVFYRIAKPVIVGFTALANWILRRFGLRPEEESALSEQELKMVVSESHEEGMISESEAGIIQKAFGFSDKRAVDIMIPIEEVSYLSLSRSFAENMAIAKRRMYTRFPLTQNGIGTIVGMVHMKDVLHDPDDWGTNEIFKKVMRASYFVPPEMPLDRLMQSLKKRQLHLAIIQDAQKTSLGIVTMEDILESLVGDIPDEYGN